MHKNNEIRSYSLPTLPRPCFLLLPKQPRRNGPDVMGQTEMIIMKRESRRNRENGHGIGGKRRWWRCRNETQTKRINSHFGWGKATMKLLINNFVFYFLVHFGSFSFSFLFVGCFLLSNSTLQCTFVPYDYHHHRCRRPSSSVVDSNLGRSKAMYSRLCERYQNHVLLRCLFVVWSYVCQPGQHNRRISSNDLVI